MSNQTLGQTLLAAPVCDAPALEAQEQQAERFAQMDGMLGRFIDHTLGATERSVEVTETRRSTTFTIVPFDDADLDYVRDTWNAERHERAGFWNLPPSLTLHSGIANLPYYQRIQPAFFSLPAFRESVRLEPSASGEATYYWGQLEPALDQLFAPLRLRGPAIAQKTEARDRGWDDFGQLASTFGFAEDHGLAPLRSAAIWVGMTRSEQIAAKASYLELLRQHVTGVAAPVLRALALRPLIERYYSKAHDGRALRKAVLTKPLQRVLAGYFAGDWFAFVEYLGEQAHLDEELIGGLPEPKILVATQDKAEEVAAATGVDADQVGAIVSAFWGNPAEASPTEERVAVLKRFWLEFDRLHAEQRPGMPTLQSIVSDRQNVTFPVVDHGPHYRTPADAYKLLPPALIADIKRHWGTLVLPRYPDRIVSAAFPIGGATTAFGDALAVWHALGMAAWRATEEMMDEDRTGVGLSRDDFDVYLGVQQSEYPIDRSVLDEMREALPRLGEPRPIDEPDQTTTTVAPGIEISVTMSIEGGMARRDGFEILRDIVTRHRRRWAEKHLDAYLAAEWHADLRAVADDYNRKSAERGKAPTVKQFAAIADVATNCWFGGDLSRTYAAIGAKSPITQTSTPLMPEDRVAFAWRVLTELGGQSTIPRPDEPRYPDLIRYYAFEHLAGEALRYVQLHEALDRPPTITEYGRTAFANESRKALPETDPDRAWDSYTAAIERALASRRDDGGTVTDPPAPPANRPETQTAAHAAESRSQRRGRFSRLLGH